MKVDNEAFLKTVRPALESGRTVSIIASGQSMLPFIKPGETIAIRRAETCRRGDIALALADGGEKIVLHYIANVSEDEITLMGAANLRQTETCRRRDILGLMASPTHHAWKIRLWHRLLPLRRYLLWLYRKTH